MCGTFSSAAWLHLWAYAGQKFVPISELMYA